MKNAPTQWHDRIRDVLELVEICRFGLAREALELGDSTPPHGVRELDLLRAFLFLQTDSFQESIEIAETFVDDRIDFSNAGLWIEARARRLGGTASVDELPALETRLPEPVTVAGVLLHIEYVGWLWDLGHRDNSVQRPGERLAWLVRQEGFARLKGLPIVSGLFLIQKHFSIESDPVQQVEVLRQAEQVAIDHNLPWIEAAACGNLGNRLRDAGDIGSLESRRENARRMLKTIGAECVLEETGDYLSRKERFQCHELANRYYLRAEERFQYSGMAVSAVQVVAARAILDPNEEERLSMWRHAHEVFTAHQMVHKRVWIACELAEELVRRNRFDEAIAFLEGDIVRLESESEAVALLCTEAAVLQQNRGQYEKALGMVERGLVAHPSADLWDRASVLMSKLGRMDDARVFQLYAMAAPSSQNKAEDLLARFSSPVEMPGKILERLDKVIGRTVVTGDRVAWQNALFNKARILARNGSHEEAIRCFNELLALPWVAESGHDKGQALFERARAEHDAGKIEVAERSAADAVDLLRVEGDSLTVLKALHHLACCLCALGHVEQAERSLKEALAVGARLFDDCTDEGIAMDIADAASSSVALLATIATNAEDLGTLFDTLENNRSRLLFRDLWWNHLEQSTIADDRFEHLPLPAPSGIDQRQSLQVLQREQQPSVTLQQARAQLRNDEVMLLFYELEDSSRVVIVPSRGSAVFLPCAVEPSVVHELRALLSCTTFLAGLKTEINQRLESLNRAFDELVKALPLDTRRLVIIPAGSLHAIPWAFVAPDHEFVVAPSARLWALCTSSQGGRSSDTNGSVLVAGNFLGDLDWAGRECAAVAKVLNCPNPRTGTGVESAWLLENLKSCEVIHFATHVRFSPNTPRLSGFSLGDGSDLTGAQVVSTKNPEGYRLVVLSGCESAAHSLGGGDEVLGLTHSFLRAGARTVVAAQWPVSDEKSYCFMTEFYRLWTHGRSVCAAVCGARNRLRNHPLLGKTFDWAAWQVHGCDCPAQDASSSESRDSRLDPFQEAVGQVESESGDPRPLPEPGTQRLLEENAVRLCGELNDALRESGLRVSDDSAREAIDVQLWLAYSASESVDSLRVERLGTINKEAIHNHYVREMQLATDLEMSVNANLWGLTAQILHHIPDLGEHLTRCEYTAARLLGFSTLPQAVRRKLAVISKVGFTIGIAEKLARAERILCSASTTSHSLYLEYFACLSKAMHGTERDNKTRGRLVALMKSRLEHDSSYQVRVKAFKTLSELTGRKFPFPGRFRFHLIENLTECGITGAFALLLGLAVWSWKAGLVVWAVVSVLNAAVDFAPWSIVDRVVHSVLLGGLIGSVVGAGIGLVAGGIAADYTALELSRAWSVWGGLAGAAILSILAMLARRVEHG